MYSDYSGVLLLGPAFSTRVLSYLECCTGDMADADDDDPNRLWCLCRQPAGEDKLVICCDLP